MLLVRFLHLPIPVYINSKSDPNPGRPRRTMTVLLGISRGSWILKPQWIPDSVAAGYWLPEHEYEAKDWFPACELSRMEKDLVKAKRGGAEDGTMGRGLLKGQKVFIGLIKAPVHEIDVLIKSCAGEVNFSLSTLHVYIIQNFS